MFADINRAIAELRDVVGVGQACHIESEIAELIARDFSIDARISRAVRQHRKRRHLIKFKQETTRKQLAA